VGDVRCWGRNLDGELGNGTTSTSLTPVAVTGISSGATIAASASHTCAEVAGGGLRCWGQNTWGQLGNGDSSGSSVPVPVAGLTDVTALRAGLHYTCAAVASDVSCWGANSAGQLGNGLVGSPVLVPSVVPEISGATAVGSSGAGPNAGHSCALVTGGAVQCWGANFEGQLGNGTNSPSVTPVLVSGLTGATAITTGAGADFTGHSCALLGTGTVSCWGYNLTGELGNGTHGTSADSNVPVAVSGLSGATAVSAGAFYTCAAVGGGEVQCWGSNSNGQLGNGTSGFANNSDVPVTVTGISDATAIAAGSFHACAIVAGGSVRCWGRNVNGQLGDGTTTSSSVPVTVVGVSGATAIAAGGAHTCAIVVGGAISCWGSDSSGELGNGAATGSAPSAVVGISGATAIAIGSAQSCALLTGGTISCWGRNVHGQLGNGTTSAATSPVAVTGISGAVAVATGGDHSCAALSGGGARCWGRNDSGQVGLAWTVPTAVVGL
jgi:alpha-tubulin suppressor-like RCC1 family protein